jgi:hypothetical protein
LELDQVRQAKEDSATEYGYWVAIEPTNITILRIPISIERIMLVAEHFIKSLIRKYGKYNISTDGVHGIHKHVDFSTLNIIIIPRLKKAS